MTIIVTGGTGFIGSSFVFHMLKEHPEDRIICHELGRPESLITHVEGCKGHDMRYAIDLTKIHRELGQLPETKFDEGVQQTSQWYLSHEGWWQTIISEEYQN